MKIKLISIILFFLGLSPYAFADCQFAISKTMMPLDYLKDQESICLGQYFELRNIGSYVQVENNLGGITVAKDSEKIQFHDYLIFETPNMTLGPDGRLKLIQLMYLSFLASLKNDFGQCELQIREGSQNLAIDQFDFFERNEAGQPGSRLMLTKNSPLTSWAIFCPNANGEAVIEKSGDYVFIFMDVYENINTDPNLKGHLAQFLFSLN